MAKKTQIKEPKKKKEAKIAGLVLPQKVFKSEKSKKEQAKTAQRTVHNRAMTTLAGVHSFKLATGEEINSLIELVEKLESLPDEVFSYHANEGKNDFSSWIKDVFALEGLSDSIKTSSKEKMRAQLLKHLLDEMMK